MNKVIFTGTIVREPEITETQKGIKCCKFDIAINQYTGRGKPDVYYPNIVTFAKTAEIAEKYLKKASKVLLECNYHEVSYVDKNNQKRKDKNFICSKIEFINNVTHKYGSNGEQQEDVDTDAPTVDLPF